jgi:hypothetical protein
VGGICDKKTKAGLTEFDFSLCAELSKLDWNMEYGIKNKALEITRAVIPAKAGIQKKQKQKFPSFVKRG